MSDSNTVRTDSAGAVVVVAARPRLAWVDATRGYCVAAVVLFHVVLWHFGSNGAEVAPAAGRLWGFVNSALGSVRMPVLLAVSGLVLARQVREGLHLRTTGFRAANNYYLYVVWLLVYAVFYGVFAQAYLHHRVDGWGIVRQLVVPATTLWYIYALALYIVVLAVVRRVPPWVVLSVLVVLSTVVHSARFGDLALWLKVPELFIFFAIGVYCADLVRGFAERANLTRLLLALVVAVGITAAGQLATTPLADSLLFVLRGTAFMALAVTVVPLAVRWHPVRRLGAALGQRTLIVYTMHPLLIGVLTIVATGPARKAFERVWATELWAVLYPLVVTLVIVLVCMGFQILAERARLGLLFEMPLRWRMRFGRTPASAPPGIERPNGVQTG